jgi:hypothetical protein
VVNRIIKTNGEFAAEVRSIIVWFDLTARKVRVPRPELAAAIAAPAQDYGVLRVASLGEFCRLDNGHFHCFMAAHSRRDGSSFVKAAQHRLHWRGRSPRP